jgi:hypothetical protein
MRIMKLLALAAAAGVVAACNGTSLTSPSPIVASDDATARVESQTLKAPVETSLCGGITQVKLQEQRPRSPGETRVEAIYLIHGVPAKCQISPVWASRPRGRLTRTENPFIVGVTQTTPPDGVQVTAQAPNGVQGSIMFR